MIRGPMLGLLALVPACFHPTYAGLKCGVGDSCPSGYTCTDEVCVPEDGPDGGGPVAQGCFGSFIKVCLDVPPAALTLTTQPIDTSDASAATKCLRYTATPAVDACVIAAQTITIPGGNTVAVIGTRPLILLARDSLTITGVLDASSRRARRGPASDGGPCPMNFTNPTFSGQGGGGWGGTFGGSGSNGGSTPGSGVGGIAGNLLNITALGGGCPGGNGAGSGGGSPGHGGGAVLLLASKIAIDGTVNASGAGGGGGKASSANTGPGGGGGGGAGGMIVLEAPTVQITGRCFANGGGGGEGGQTGSPGLDGNAGSESSAPDSTGDGGTLGTFRGGDGGDGGVGTRGATAGGAGEGTSDAGGGGGGGGGVGIIKILSPQPSMYDPTKVSPRPN
jgi:hypothetical protein